MTARLVRLNRSAQSKVRIVFSALCIGAAIALLWAEREAVAQAFAWLHQRRLVFAAIAAVASAVVVARRRTLKRAELARSWLAAVPVKSGVLIEGRLKHEWRNDDLRQLRECHGDFEAALAHAIGAT